jgi:threonine/homoserine/homoserine lactone efflux protein
MEIFTLTIFIFSFSTSLTPGPNNIMLFAPAGVSGRPAVFYQEGFVK